MPPLHLGSLLLSSPLILAPLERVSYLPFRHLCAQNGASLTFTEMIRAKSITSSTPVTMMIDTIDSTTPTGLQLSVATAGELTDCLEHMAVQIETNKQPHWKNIAVIDLNFGCPKVSLFFCLLLFLPFFRLFSWFSLFSSPPLSLLLVHS